MDTSADAVEISTYEAKVNVRLGIIKEFAHAHKYYVGACRDMGVPYKMIDISMPGWIDTIQNSGCDAFLVRPSSEFSIWKQMYDERLRIIVEDLGKIIYPTYNELWFYESKRRMCYWLQSHAIPHPKTWVFYNCDEALDFARNTILPIVFKSDFGSSASGVRIFHSRPRLIRWIKLCFAKGIVRKNEDPRDRLWGSVLLQEHLHNAKEWRVIRLGDSYFAHQKIRKGQFHSGSGKFKWYDPPKRLLDFARDVTDKGNFTSMNLDTFETSDGRYLINELQSTFGAVSPYQMLVKGEAGRYIYDYNAKSWCFEKGIFCQNGCCNLRVKALVEKLGKHVELPQVNVDTTVSKKDKEASINDLELYYKPLCQLNSKFHVMNKDH